MVWVFTGYAVFEPITTKSAEAVTHAIVSVFYELSCPEIIQSENGTEFSNKRLEEMVKTT